MRTKQREAFRSEAMSALDGMTETQLRVFLERTKRSIEAIKGDLLAMEEALRLEREMMLCVEERLA